MSPQLMPPIATNKHVDSNTERQNASVDFSKLNYLGESINTYDIGNKYEWKSDFPKKLVLMARQTLNFPLEIHFQYCSI